MVCPVTHEKTGSKKLSNLPKVTQVVRGRFEI